MFRKKHLRIQQFGIFLCAAFFSSSSFSLSYLLYQYKLLYLMGTLFLLLSSHSVVERELNVPLPLSKIIKKWNNLLQEYKVSLITWIIIFIYFFFSRLNHLNENGFVSNLTTLPTIVAAAAFVAANPILIRIANHRQSRHCQCVWV